MAAWQAAAKAKKIWQHEQDMSPIRTSLQGEFAIWANLQMWQIGILFYGKMVHGHRLHRRLAHHGRQCAGGGFEIGREGESLAHHGRQCAGGGFKIGREGEREIWKFESLAECIDSYTTGR